MSARWWALGVVAIATFMLMLDLTIVYVTMPVIRNDLGGSFDQLQWVVDAYALTLAVFLLTSGAMADRWGRKKVFLVGFLAFTLGSLWCGAADSIEMLDVARGAQGIGASILFAVGPGLLGHEFRGGRERGLAFGIFGGAAGLAIALGPLLGGWISDELGWRWVFLVNVPVGVIAVQAGLAGMRESRTETSHPVDWPGLVTFSAGLSSLVLALILGNSRGWTSEFVVSLLIGSAVFLVAFVLTEQVQGERAMLDLSLFRIPTFLAVGLTALVGNATVLASLFLLTSWMSNVAGFSALGTGLRCLPLTLVLFVTAGVTGLVLAKIPPWATIGAGMLFVGAGLVLFARLKAEGPWTAVVPGMILIGFGVGMFFPARAALSVAVTAPEHAGMASGIGETFQQVGAAVGIAGFGALFQYRVNDTFADSAIGRLAGVRAHEISEGIAAGGAREIAHLLPPQLLAAFDAAAGSAFGSGLHTVFLACGAVAAASAVLGMACVRSRHLHPSAQLNAVGAPAEVPDEPDAEAGPEPQPQPEPEREPQQPASPMPAPPAPPRPAAEPGRRATRQADPPTVPLMPRTRRPATVPPPAPAPAPFTVSIPRQRYQPRHAAAPEPEPGPRPAPRPVVPSPREAPRPRGTREHADEAPAPDPASAAAALSVCGATRPTPPPGAAPAETPDPPTDTTFTAALP